VFVCLDASGEAMRLGLAESPDLIKPNAEEASELTGIPVDSIDAAREASRRLLSSGVRMVALSMGPAGLLLSTGDGSSVWAHPPACVVTHAVGAGDALLAGLCWRLSLRSANDQLDLAELARWAVATGTAAATSRGVSFADLAEVRLVYEKVIFLRQESTVGDFADHSKDWPDFGRV
jgi:fructose-1-phosphate kinase PfkB-like protein